MHSKLLYYYFFYFVLSFVISLLVMPALHTLSFRLGAVDSGSGRRSHLGTVPRLGGVGLYLAFMLPAAFSLSRGEWDEFHTMMTGVLAAGTVVFALGVLDDIRGVRPWRKLGVEIVAAMLVYAWGVRVEAVTSPWGEMFLLGALSLPATVLWIIVITNAMNLIDGIDGLAAGTGILIAATLLFAGREEVHMALLCVILIGALAGFLRYNFPPATIFMGDSGSLFLGFLLASISIVSAQKAAAAASIMVPFVVFGFPLLDMLYAVVRRLYRGIPLSRADREHIHHKLLARGMTNKTAVLLLYALNICIMIVVLLILRNNLRAGFFFMLAALAVAVAASRMVGYFRFIPLFKDAAHAFQRGRRRRYLGYVVRRFRQDAASAAASADMARLVEGLSEEFGFSRLSVRLYGREDWLVEYVRPVWRGEAAAVSFPIIDKGRAVGEVRIEKDVNDADLYGVSELMPALSEELLAFARRTGGGQDA